MRRNVRLPSAEAGERNPACLGQLDDFLRNAVGSCGIGGPYTSIALIDLGDVDIVPGDGLHGPRKPFDLATILGAGRRHMKREQMPQRVDRPVEFRSFLALAAVIAGTFATLGRGAQRPAVDDCRGRLG